MVECFIVSSFDNPISKCIYAIFQLVLEVRAIGHYRGDIAIDDFTVTGTVCSGEREFMM